MPSDKHNSRTARARDLIPSLINVASSRDVHFHQPQQPQWLHNGATFVPLWSPILSSLPRRVTICGRHIMASVRNIQITEALLTLCLALVCYETSLTLLKSRHYGFTYRDMGRAFHEYILHILHIYRNDWMDCIDTVLFMLFFAYIAV